MKNIQKLMRDYKFEEAVGMFRAARFVPIFYNVLYKQLTDPAVIVSKPSKVLK